jgi:hypothetical protein
VCACFLPGTDILFCSGLDFTPSTKDKRTFSDDTPVIIVGHGLTGGS